MQTQVIKMYRERPKKRPASYFWVTLFLYVALLLLAAFVMITY